MSSSVIICGHPERKLVSCGRCWDCHIAYLRRFNPRRAERLIEHKRLKELSSFDYASFLSRMINEFTKEDNTSYDYLVYITLNNSDN